MVSKFFWILTLSVSFSGIFGQEEFLNCDYYVELTNEYTCPLKIFNPNGLNNFTDINGTHVPGKCDDDVQIVSVFIVSTTPIIPSIICEKFKNVKRLSFSFGGLVQIDENSLKKCRNLTNFQISNNDIEDRLDENAFIENFDLLELYMETHLPALPENIFRNQEKLEILVLRYNEFTDLPQNVFKTLKSLKVLNLDSNLLTTLRAEWFEPLEKLEVLSFAYNQLEELPANIFSSLTNLKAIALLENKFKVIHSDWFGILPNLESILLQKNQIFAIDEKLLDSTGVNDIAMLRNVCADKNVVDNSDTKGLIRAVLRQCFDNYQNMTSG